MQKIKNNNDYNSDANNNYSDNNNEKSNNNNNNNNDNNNANDNIDIVDFRTDISDLNAEFASMEAGNHVMGIGLDLSLHYK